MAEDKSFMETMSELSPEDQEEFLDELIEQFETMDWEYIEALDEDDPLRVYHQYYLNPVAEEDFDEEAEAPLLFATVPMNGNIPKILNPDELIPVLTTVQITGVTGFGEVFITTNLKPTETRNARANYASLFNYRSEVNVKFNP